MKNMRKFFAIVLAIMILMGNVDYFQQKIKATSRSADEAINYVKSLIGQSIDKDGAYGAQCVDLILAYYDYLGVPRSSGNGADYTWNALPSGWQRIQGAQPQKGDILVYTGGTGNRGHVAIYEADRITYHQNIDGNTKVQQVGYKYNGLDTPYWGVIRPNWVNTPKPANPRISLNQYWYDLKDTIIVTAHADGATSYYTSVYKDNMCIIGKNVSDGVLSFSATEFGLGKYSVYFSCTNSAGTVDTEWLDFQVVGKPSYNGITTLKNTYKLTDKVIVSVQSVCAKGEVIGIDKEGAGRVITTECGPKFEINAKELGVGNFSAYFSIYNGSGGIDTEKIYFTIIDETITNESMTTTRLQEETTKHQEQTTSYKPSETTKPIETTREEVTKSQELISKKPSVKPTIVNKMLVIKKPVLTKVKNIKGKKAKLKIKKVRIHYNGYVSSKIKMEIMYARDKKFKKGRKIKTVKGYNFDTSKIISKLKKKKYYFKFRVRIEYWSDNYKTNYKYSSWSNVKKVRIKK